MAVLVCLAGALASCTGSGGPARGGELTGVTWSVTSVAGYGSPPPGLFATARFAGGKVSGSDGCNTYGGSYTTTSDGDFAVRGLASTEIGCSDPVETFTSAYGRAFGRAASYAANGGVLTLYDSEGKPLVRYAGDAPPPIAGLAWRVFGYRNGPVDDKQAVVTPLAGSSITATFGTDGKLTGSTGCNTYSADYRTSGSRFELGQIAVTERACVEEKLMRQESAYLAALRSATSWQFSGSAFALLNSRRTVAVTFGRRDLAISPRT